jgi:PKD repeat protein
MAFNKKKSSLLVGLLIILTAFVGIQIPVSAAGEPPVADAGGPYLGEECNSILLNASGSYDPEGDSLTYRWNFSGVWIENYYYPYMEWTWFDDFSGIITLEVSDGTTTDTDTANVTILNVPPVILSIEGPTTVDVETEFLLMVNFFDGMADPRFRIASLDMYTATFYWDDGTSTELLLGVEEFWANASHVYSESGAYHIIVTIVDNNGGEAIAEWDVIVGGIALVEAGPEGVIDEGSTFLSSGFLADTDSSSYTAIVDYYDETGAQPLLFNTGNTFDLNHTFLDNGFYAVLVTVFNEDVEYGSDTANVTVNNVAPSIESMSLSPTDPVPPDTPVELMAMFSDPGVLDTHTAAIEWGDGQITSSDVPFGTYLVSESHIYANAGVYQIILTVTDKDGGSDSMTLEYTLVYYAMNVDAGPDGFINEGDIFTSTGSLTGLGDNLYTATVDYGDGSGPQPLSLSSDYLFDLSHQYLEDGIYTVVVTIFKDGAALMSDSALVSVYNVAPIITSLSQSSSNTGHCNANAKAISLLGDFTDPGVLDSHVVLIQWGDGQTTTVDLPAGIYQVRGNHTYASAGVYTITLTVTDDDGGSDSESITIEIAKSCCGFPTGCGWMKFAFVSKCKKGHTLPGGCTMFQFHLAHMNFHSHVYKLLSCMGTKPACK